jgi:glycosyltransferase involved in cell wall biosynthesis
VTRTVLLIHRGGDAMRGTEICLIQSARAFAAEGMRVVVCRNEPVMDDSLAAIEPPPRVLPMDFPELKLDGKDTAFPLARYLGGIRSLRRLMLEIRPALVYCSGGLPCQMAVPVARLHRVPVVCHFHHPAIKRDYYSWLVKLADKIIFPSQFTRTHSIKKARLDGEVVYNGIDVTRFQPLPERDPAWRQQWRIPAEAVVIGQVGALAPNKRPEMLVRAFARLRARTGRPVHLVLVGKGALSDSLRALVQGLGLESSVSLTGAVPDVLPFYQHIFDINALVSREEGLGIAAIEGSACGLPVVATDCTGLSETVVPDTTGLRFDLNDEARLEEHLLRLTHDEALRKRLGAAGREHAVRTFSAAVYNSQILAATRDLMRRAS